MILRVAGFDNAYDLAAFRSGNSQLDTWLHDHAELGRGQGPRTYVVVLENGDVAGYFPIAPHVLDRAEASTRLARGGPSADPFHFVGETCPEPASAGRGFGAELLVGALGTIVEAARVAGGKVVVVDAIDAGVAAFLPAPRFPAAPESTRPALS